MKVKSSFLLCMAIVACAALAGAANASILFSEGFDSSAADVKVNKSADSVVTYVDYSNMTVGATNFSIAEAPNMVSGSAATRGVLLQVNNSGEPGATGAPAAVNILAGNTPINFSGSYAVSYDVYMSSSNPGGTGSTLQTLFGLGTDDSGVLEASFNRAGGSTVGTWGWLTNENGAGTEDVAINMNATELADLGDTNVDDIAAGVSPGVFNQAFAATSLGTLNHSAALQWVHVDLRINQGNVKLLFNGVPFFPNAKDPVISSLADSGFALLGLEDRFASISDEPDLSWALYDNFVVTAIPEPSTALLLGLASLGLASCGRRRK